MHRFHIEVRGRKLVASDPSKQEFLDRLLDDYERRNITVDMILQIPEKDINANQYGLYKAFILKAAKHFGTDFRDMQNTLKNLHPTDFAGNNVEVPKWTTEQLNTFISQSSSYLATYGFHF